MLTGPQIIIHGTPRRTAVGAAGLSPGNSPILEGGQPAVLRPFVPASQIIVRGDLTYYKDGWPASHEFQTGFFLAPRNTYDQRRPIHQRRLLPRGAAAVDVNNPSPGTVPFRRRYADPDRAADAPGARPQLRLLPAGQLEADAAPDGEHRRPRRLRPAATTRSSTSSARTCTSVQPRLGFSYLLTNDAKNVLRGSYVRVDEQVMGRDAVTLFGADGAAGHRRHVRPQRQRRRSRRAFTTPARDADRWRLRVRPTCTSRTSTSSSSASGSSSGGR